MKPPDKKKDPKRTHKVKLNGAINRTLQRPMKDAIDSLVQEVTKSWLMVPRILQSTFIDDLEGRQRLDSNISSRTLVNHAFTASIQGTNPQRHVQPSVAHLNILSQRAGIGIPEEGQSTDDSQQSWNWASALTGWASMCNRHSSDYWVVLENHLTANYWQWTLDFVYMMFVATDSPEKSKSKARDAARAFLTTAFTYPTTELHRQAIWILGLPPWSQSANEDEEEEISVPKLLQPEDISERFQKPSHFPDSLPMPGEQKSVAKLKRAFYMLSQLESIQDRPSFINLFCPVPQKDGFQPIHMDIDTDVLYRMVCQSSEMRTSEAFAGDFSHWQVKGMPTLAKRMLSQVFEIANATHAYANARLNVLRDSRIYRIASMFIGPCHPYGIAAAQVLEDCSLVRQWVDSWEWVFPAESSCILPDYVDWPEEKPKKLIPSHRMSSKCNGKKVLFHEALFNAAYRILERYLWMTTFPGFKELENKGRHCGSYATTNGYELSMVFDDKRQGFKEPIKTAEDEKETAAASKPKENPPFTFLKGQESLPECDRFTHVSSVDPGVHNFWTVYTMTLQHVVQDCHRESAELQPTIHRQSRRRYTVNGGTLKKYTAAMFYEKSGNRESQRWHERVKSTNPQYRKSLEHLKSFNTASRATFDEAFMSLSRVAEYLLHFQSAVTWRKQRYQRWLDKKKATDAMVRGITAGKRRVLVVLGNWSGRKNFKGTRRGPMKELKEALIQHPRVEVLEVNESYTSKRCSRCCSSMSVCTGLRLWKHPKNCRKDETVADKWGRKSAFICNCPVCLDEKKKESMPTKLFEQYIQKKQRRESEKPRASRDVVRCSHCGEKLDRDKNAAVNIYNVFIEMCKQEDGRARPEYLKKQPIDTLKNRPEFRDQKKLSSSNTTTHHSTMDWSKWSLDLFGGYFQGCEPEGSAGHGRSRDSPLQSGQSVDPKCRNQTASNQVKADESKKKSRRRVKKEKTKNVPVPNTPKPVVARDVSIKSPVKPKRKALDLSSLDHSDTELNHELFKSFFNEGFLSSLQATTKARGCLVDILGLSSEVSAAFSNGAFPSSTLSSAPVSQVSLFGNMDSSTLTPTVEQDVHLHSPLFTSCAPSSCQAGLRPTLPPLKEVLLCINLSFTVDTVPFKRARLETWNTNQSTNPLLYAPTNVCDHTYPCTCTILNGCDDDPSFWHSLLRSQFKRNP